MENKKIFITGGTGFIGKNLIRLLEREKNKTAYVLTRTPDEKPSKANIRYIQGDIRDKALLNELFAEIKPECLVHFAWDVKTSDYAFSEDNFAWAKRSRALLNAFLKCGGKSAIVSGTCFEYDLNLKAPHYESEIPHPLTPYGRSKMETFVAFSELCREYNARLVWGRIFYPYGMGEEKRKLLSAVYETLTLDKEFVCKTPNDIIDYINVADVAKIFADFIDNEDAEGIINIGTGKGQRVGDLLYALAVRLNKPHLLKFAEGDAAKHIVADITKLRSLYKPSFVKMDENLNYLGMTEENNMISKNIANNEIVPLGGGG